MIEITDDMIRLLAVITTHDGAGRHFTEAYPGWEDLELCGLIDVYRPEHKATGIRYSPEFWTLDVTADGLELVAASEHLHQGA